MIDGLKAEYRDAIIDILAANERVERAVLFGSRAMETFTPASDVDIALFGDRLTLTDQANLAAAIDELPMAQRVDLLLYKTVDNDALRRHIEQHGVEWYRRRGQEEWGRANEWSETPLGDLVEIYDGPHATPKKTANGPIFLGISNLDNGRLNLSQTNHLSEEDFKRWTRRVIPQKDDIVFSYETRLGEAAQIPPNLHCCLGRRMGLLRPKTDKIDARFLLYAYLGPRFQETLQSRTIHGSTVDRIPLTEMGSFPVDIPRDINEQRAIAHLLGTLDDKIELNRRMNETLEEMARTLFKSWFVDFDPVHAKAALRNHTANRSPLDWTVERARAYLGGMDPSIAALFPDSFVDSELGDVPEGWEVGVLDNVIEIYSGGTPKTAITKYWDGDIPWYTAKDAPSLSDVFVLETERSITQAGVENSAAKMLPAGTTIITARGTVGRLACLGIPMTMNQTCYGIRGVQGYPAFFTYMNIKMTVNELQQRTHGTIFDTITRQTFELIDAIIPPPKLADKFETVIQPIMSHILSSLNESRALTALRDTLLPKLISGELRIGEKAAYDQFG